MSRRSTTSQKKKASSSQSTSLAPQTRTVAASRTMMDSESGRLASSLLHSLVSAGSADAIVADYSSSLDSDSSQRADRATVTTINAIEAFEADQISAIEAAEEILAEVIESGTDYSAPVDEESDSDNSANDAARRGQDLTRNTSSTAPSSVSAVSAASSTGIDAGSLRDDLQQLGTMLRDEFKNSISELQAAQSAAITAQSEVLRALTEMIYQSASSNEIPAESLERAFSGVEERLLARIEAVSGGQKASGGTAHSSSSSTGKSQSSPSPIKLQNAASSVNRSWEQIRNEMMAKGELTETPSLSNERRPLDKPVGQLHDVAQLSSDRHFRLPDQDPSLEIPRTVDPDALSDQELRNAFREREAFITTLIARIRRQQELATGQMSPDQLRALADELPEELAVQVRHTLKQMDDLARMGELELSLERARIARQVNQLEHSRMTIERNARQLGLHVNPDGTIDAPANQPGRHSSSRRWLGKLGFGQ